MNHFLLQYKYDGKVQTGCNWTQKSLSKTKLILIATLFYHR